MSQRDSLSNQPKARLERRDKILSREYIKNRWIFELHKVYTVFFLDLTLLCKHRLHIPKANLRTK